MALSAQTSGLSASRATRGVGIHSRSARKTGRKLKGITTHSGATEAAPSTVFDLLYEKYVPFRLYTDYMLGASCAMLAKQFGLSEHWVAERIEALRLCLEKQVRLNLLDTAPQLPPVH